MAGLGALGGDLSRHSVSRRRPDLEPSLHIDATVTARSTAQVLRTSWEAQSDGETGGRDGVAAFRAS